MSIKGLQSLCLSVFHLPFDTVLILVTRDKGKVVFAEASNDEDGRTMLELCNAIVNLELFLYLVESFLFLNFQFFFTFVIDEIILFILI